MTLTSPPSPVAVLDDALDWTHRQLEAARGRPFDAPTPCRAWHLGDLLGHMEESLATMAEAAALGRIELPGPTCPGGPEDVSAAVDRIVLRACRTREAWHRRITSAPVTVGDLPLGRDTLVLVGALEIAVHGWDVARAGGATQPLPDPLAATLLPVALSVVGPEERGHRFADPVPVPDGAAPGVRLLAHLGRRS